MATGLQIKNSTQIISGGYVDERHGVTGAGYTSWTDVPLSGSVTLSYYYADSDSGNNANSSCVYVTIRDSWNATKDSSTNKLTVRITSQLVSVTRGSLVGYPGTAGRFMWAFPDRGTSAVWTGVGYPNQPATYLASPGITLSERTIVINPESTVSKGTIYYKGGMVGHENDPTPSAYVDEFWMGSQFRNVLPDKPPKPTVAVGTHTPVDCQTLTTTVNITQGRYGDYGVETAYARHKIGSGNWTQYSRVTTQRNGVYTIENIPPATQVQVEAYSTGDGTESDHQVITFTTPSRPQPATLTFASQTAESDQLTLRANISYTQPLNPAHGTTTTYMRYGYRGRNLVNMEALQCYQACNDVSIQDHNSLIYSTPARTTTATSTSFSAFWMQLKPNTTYTFSAKHEILSGTPIANTGAIRIRLGDSGDVYTSISNTGKVTFTTESTGKTGLLFYNYWNNPAGSIPALKLRFYDIQLEEGNQQTLFVPYLQDMTDWKPIATNSASGAFTIRAIPNSREVVVETYTVGDGLCSADKKQVSFFTPVPIDKPIHEPFAQTDTGSCINVTMPWSQPDHVRFNTVHTYYAYHIDNSTWSNWVEHPNPNSGITSVTCVPYGSTLCVRTYSVGDGLKGETTLTCIKVSEKPVDDRPYEGDTFLVEPVCDSLHYLAELICQEWYAIREGDMIVYTNEEHKEHCDGDEDDPTLHSMLSRIYRFFGAIVCLVCDGANDDLNFYKRGPKQTVLQSAGDGEYSEWVEPDTEVTENSTKLVTSDGIYKAIDEFIHTAYYYIGDFDYLTLNPSTLADVKYAEAGDNAMVKNGAGGTNQIYTYDGENWIAGEVKDLDDFDMVHVNKESSWIEGLTSVYVPAGSGWYWYNNNWNHLDATSDAMQEELDHLLDANMMMKQDSNEEDMQFTTINRNPDGTVSTPIRPTAKTIYFVTEEI